MTDELRPRRPSHRRRPRRSPWRRRARLVVRATVSSITVLLVAVGGSAAGLFVPNIGSAIEKVTAPIRGDAEPSAHRDAAPRQVQPRTPAAGPTQGLSSGSTLSPSPRPTPSATERASHSTSRDTGRSRHRHHRSSPSPAAPASSPTSPSPTPDQPAGSFRVASFNVLGASHTGPGSQRPRFATGATRTPWAVQLLNGAGITVAGLQEFQAPQIRVFNQVATGWRAWPGLGSPAGVNSLVWRTSEWQAVETHTLPIPYFGGRDVPMPYVLLRQVGTGREVWFANFHNPADAHGPAQRWRDEAVRREVALVNRLHADGTPVVVTGDFNDRDDFFCPLAEGAGVTSADGSHLTGSTCQLAPNAGVDWVVGTSDDVDFSDFHRVRSPLVSRTSDHPFVWARATAR